MKRFLTLVAVATVAGAMYVAAAPGSQQSRGPTARQFAALKRQVAGLSKTLKQVKTLAVAEAGLLIACDNFALPIDQFGPANNPPEQGYEYQQTNSTMILTSALDAASPDDQTAVWIAGGDSTCGALINGTGGLRHAAAVVGVRLPHALLHPSFAAHRP
jgi:hypothetical protein